MTKEEFHKFYQEFMGYDRAKKVEMCDFYRKNNIETKYKIARDILYPIKDIKNIIQKVMNEGYTLNAGELIPPQRIIPN